MLYRSAQTSQPSILERSFLHTPCRKADICVCTGIGRVNVGAATGRRRQTIRLTAMRSRRRCRCSGAASTQRGPAQFVSRRTNLSGRPRLLGIRRRRPARAEIDRWPLHRDSELIKLNYHDHSQIPISTVPWTSSSNGYELQWSRPCIQLH